jgi:hypothetical protein
VHAFTSAARLAEMLPQIFDVNELQLDAQYPCPLPLMFPSKRVAPFGACVV